MKEIAFTGGVRPLPSAGTPAPPLRGKQGATFEDMLRDSVRKVNQLQSEADEAVRSLATGSETDIHRTMIALEKAEVSFELMMQVRNKIISAYEEVMRMQF